MASGPDACRNETGYPARILHLLYEIYETELFDDDDPPLTNLKANGVATMNHFHFYLVYKYIHVSTEIL